MSFDKNHTSLIDVKKTETKNQIIERREFLKKSFIFLAGAGFAFIPALPVFSSGNDNSKKRIFAIDPDKCNGCGKCIRKCGQEALLIKDKKAEIDQKKCRGCGNCVQMCRRKAIGEKNNVSN